VGILTEESFSGSSWISGAKYDTETQIMQVYIGSDTYECVGVPEGVWSAFKNAGSKGQFFNKNIRGQYNHAMFE